MPDLIDQLYARGLGVHLTDAERIRALKAERDGAFVAIDRLEGFLASSLHSAEKWRRRWVWIFGLLMAVLVIDGLVVVWMWVRQ